MCRKALAALDDHRAGERILGQHLLRQCRQAVRAAAEINRKRPVIDV
jgi:hypothetical protein